MLVMQKLYLKREEREDFEGFSLADIFLYVLPLSFWHWHEHAPHITLKVEYEYLLDKMFYISCLFLCSMGYHAHQTHPAIIILKRGKWIGRGNVSLIVANVFLLDGHFFIFQHLLTLEREVRQSFPRVFARRWKENTRIFLRLILKMGPHI